MTTYREYYAACRAAYDKGQSAAGLSGLGVRSQRPGSASGEDLFRLEDGYDDLVAELALVVDRRFRDGHGLYRNSDLQVSSLAVQLDEFWDIGCLETLAELLTSQAEPRLLGCHGVVNQVNLIRSLPDRGTPASSWLWHYDNKPDEAFKILIYLTDVEEQTGAFEYLHHPETADIVKVPSSRIAPDQVRSPRWPKSRVPADVMAEYHDAGYRSCRVVGPRGTLIAFDNNCVHRATIPRHRHRDAVIFNVRPSHEPVRPRISRRHTGSWSFNAKAWIPELIDLSAAEVGSR